MRRSLTVLLGSVALLVVAACGATGPRGAAPSDTGRSPGSTDQRTVAATPTNCPELATAIVDTLQRYVDQFGEVSADEMAAAPAPSEVDLRSEADAIQRHADELGCDRDELEERVRVELRGLTGEGPVAAAVAATLRSQILGTGDPSDRASQQLHVTTAQELAAAVATVGSGSTITIEPGTYAFDETLILLRPVTLVGGGRDDTRLVSSATGAGFVYLGEGELRVEDVTLAHDGDNPATVAIVRSGSYRFQRVRVTGGVADPDAQVGFGIVLRSTDRSPAAASATQVLADVEITDNAGGGIAVSGADQPTLEGLLVRDNDRCGVCYLDRSGGSLEDSRVESNLHGVEIAGTAEPDLEDNDITANAEAGLLYAEESGGSAARNIISGSTIGIQVGDSADPRLDANRIEGATEAAVVLTGSSGGSIRGTACVSSRLGIALLERSDPDIGANDCDIEDAR